MKRHFIIAIRYTFYIAALLFFEDYIAISFAALLISLLFYENKYYSFLPLILIVYMSPVYSIILICIYLYYLLLSKYINKNRYYSLALYFISMLTINIITLITKNYNINILYTSLFTLIISSIFIMLHSFYKKNNKYLAISINDKLIHLTMILAYLLLIFFYNPNPILYMLLFMQLFIIFDFKYNILLTIIYTLLSIIFKDGIDNSVLSYTSISFLPPLIILYLNLKDFKSYLYITYSILLALLKIKNKNITIENDYISNLFKDFKSYLKALNIEYDKLNTIKALKENHLELIQESFCKGCKEDSLCRFKLDKRYSFLCNAINHQNFNIYSCPHYDKFFLNTNVDIKSEYIELNAINNLADELEYLYQQNIKMAKYYNKFINSLSFYDYKIINIDINLSSTTIYFSLFLDKSKIIIHDLFLRLAYKAFNEELEIKVVENDINYIVHLFKKPRVKLDYSHKILAKNNNVISGDNYYIKKEFNDSYIFALSDGMGSGYNAYKESSDALRLISSLLSYHFSLKTILKMLEDIYDLKCEYDSYATLDILNINTASMKLNLYKMGSSNSYIYHNKELALFENRALPLKLDDINSTYEIEFFKDDVIILISDGISDFLSKEELSTDINYSLSSNKIVEDIINKLKKKENNDLKDDASIIVIKVI